MIFPARRRPPDDHDAPKRQRRTADGLVLVAVEERAGHLGTADHGRPANVVGAFHCTEVKRFTTPSEQEVLAMGELPRRGRVNLHTDSFEFPVSVQAKDPVWLTVPVMVHTGLRSHKNVRLGPGMKERLELALVQRNGRTLRAHFGDAAST